MVNSCGRPRTELTGGPANPASASSGLRSSREPGQESFRRKPAPLAFMKISAGAAEPDSGCRRAGVPQGCASARFSQRNSDHRSDELWTLARLWPCAARQREPSPTRATASPAQWSSYDTGGEAHRDQLNFTASTSLPTNSQSAITLAQESAHPVPHHNPIRRRATFTQCEPTITAAGLSAVRFEEGFRLEAAMANVGQTWTEDRIELLTKLWREGLSASQIAAELPPRLGGGGCSASKTGEGRGGAAGRTWGLGKANRLDLVPNEEKGGAPPRHRRPARPPLAGGGTARAAPKCPRCDRRSRRGG